MADMLFDVRCGAAPDAPMGSRKLVPVESALGRRRGASGRPLAFLFTDLEDAMGLYERLGDAIAYEVVRRHFAFVVGIVHGYDGVVVKTIGDAVMAVFGTPADAVKAALVIQARLEDLDRSLRATDDDLRLSIKLAVHCGDSVRVELDGKLDYFGAAVHLAARLRDQSGDGDIVLSQAVAEHPRVRPLLEALPTREELRSLKGLEEPVRFVRVAPARRRVARIAPSNRLASPPAAPQKPVAMASTLARLQARALGVRVAAVGE
jgi:class 3 adenylate cyclase